MRQSLSLCPLSLTFAGISENRRGPGPNIPVCAAVPEKDTEGDVSSGKKQGLCEKNLSQKNVLVLEVKTKNVFERLT